MKHPINCMEQVVFLEKLIVSLLVSKRIVYTGDRRLRTIIFLFLWSCTLFALTLPPPSSNKPKILCPDPQFVYCSACRELSVLFLVSNFRTPASSLLLN